MSSTATDSSLRAARQGKLYQRVQIAGVVALGALAVSLLVWLAPRWLPLLTGTSATSDEADATSADATAAEAPPTEVTVPAEKLATAGLKLGNVTSQPLAASRTAAGRFDYDHSRHLELKSPAAGVVKELRVEPGERVAAGQLLAVLTSQEVGLARDQVLAHDAELELAKKELAFRQEIATHVGELLSYFRSMPPLADLEARFAGRTLGEYRDKVLSAYAKLKLAESVATSTAGLTQGAISGRLAEERKLAREVASAGFQAACEQAEFDARIARDKAAAAVAHAERLRKISQESLAALLGPHAAPLDTSAAAPLSEFALLAPYAATVSERLIAPSERVTLGQTLFVLADNNRLWISAEIHERDWELLKLSPGEAIEVRAPAIPDRSFSAKVRHIGATVSAETRSVPLIAEIDNSTGLFKPGMFAWVTLPTEAARPRTVVPAAAVVRHEDRPFVFVPAGENRFRRVDVTVGLETSEWIEVTSGLRAGDEVVTQGAFFLKSELLLEREE